MFRITGSPGAFLTRDLISPKGGWVSMVIRVSRVADLGNSIKLRIEHVLD